MRLEHSMELAERVAEKRAEAAKETQVVKEGENTKSQKECPRCHHVFSAASVMEIHLKTCDGILECQWCLQTFRLPAYRKAHEKYCQTKKVRRRSKITTVAEEYGIVV